MGVVVWTMIFIVSHSLIGTHANTEVDALYAFRQALQDPNDILTNWNDMLVNPTTWWRVVCDNNERVTRVNLGRTGLSGTLVGDLGKLTKLEHLLLNNNNISGAIPNELGGLTSLLGLDLSTNLHTGPIPDSFGSIKTLRYLRLGNNKLTGVIPETLAGLTDLLVLNLSNNQLSGKVPQGLFKLQKLRYLDLTNNPNLKNVQCADEPCYFSSAKA